MLYPLSNRMHSAVSARRPARHVPVLVALLALLVAQHLEAAGSIIFDGVNIWVTTPPSVTKLLASSGAIVGTYPVAPPVP